MTGVVLAARVQSHPSRRELRERLLPGLKGMPVEIVETEFTPPNPWLGYLECLHDPPDCTHLLIVQDDTITCRNLPRALEMIATSRPNNVICVFLGRVPMRTRGDALMAGSQGEVYVEVRHGDFLPVVAVMWPVEKAVDFHAWGSSPSRLVRRSGRGQVTERSDDAMGGRWIRVRRERVLATIPSLVEHPDDVPSTIAKRPANRTALFWKGQDFDAASVNW